MILTKGQQKGLDVVLQRYQKGEKYTVISGYAGSGKSTLIRFIVEALPVDEDDVVYATYTGKAAQVLLNKGNKNVTTLHKLLYEFFPRPDGTFSKVARKELEYHIVIVDEVSMAPKSLMDLLFTHGCYVICLGDPFQLPPVSKDEDNHLLDSPHVFLDEIVRQAKDSEIIRLSMEIREQKPISTYKGDNIQVINKRNLSTGMMQWADQIIVATNKTRISINQQMRQLCGYEGDKPQEGDKVICCHNYWDIFSKQYNSLINGTIGFLKDEYEDEFRLPYYLGGDTIDITSARFITDTNDEFERLDMDTNMIVSGEPALSRQLIYKIRKNPKIAFMVPFEFTYGYAITCHKAQGSSWPKVLILEESFPFDREEHARWLYTSITRSEDKIVLLR